MSRSKHGHKSKLSTNWQHTRTPPANNPSTNPPPATVPTLTATKSIRVPNVEWHKENGEVLTAARIFHSTYADKETEIIAWRKNYQEQTKTDPSKIMTNMAIEELWIENKVSHQIIRFV
jgi:hypothetical protein